MRIAAHTDWLFETRVVADELLQLQSNWFSDFRTTTRNTTFTFSVGFSDRERC